MPNYNYRMTNPILLDTGDASKALVADPGDGFATLVKAIYWDIRTSAAQAVKIGKSGGTDAQQILQLPASATGVGQRVFEGDGFKMPSSEAITAVPAAAGPAILFNVQYVTIPVSAGE